jgi:plastocyanin
MRHLVPGRVVVRALVALAVALVAFAPRLTPPVLGAGASVHIGDALSPAELTIAPGSTVTWVNDSGNRHRMRSTSGATEFDSGDMDPGQTFSVTFATVGTWQYRDERNKDLSNYWGMVTVAEAPTPPPPPPPTPKPGTSAPPATPVPPTPAPPPGDILMAGRVFSPGTVTIDAGTTVRWRNNDGREHTVTANDRSFDSGVMRVGATFVKTFTTPGTFGYICAIHPDMTGTIAVRSASGGTPPPPPPPTPSLKPTPVPSSPPGGGGGGGSASGDVRIVDFAFSPASLNVVAGTTVKWVNDGAALHTVTANDGSFDSGLISAGGTFSRRFGTPGTYLYLCGLHPAMTGIVRVSGADGATPPPPPPPTAKPTKPPVSAGELELRDFAFFPSSIRVTPGTTLTWVNTGAAPHTVTDRAGSFDSGTIARGTRWSRTFASPGTFRLICAIHPEMTATLTVAAPGATAPPPASAPPVSTPAPGSNVVAIVDFDYAPQVLHVAVGTTIRWVNQGVAPHTVTAKDRSFDSGFLSTNDAYTWTFAAEGTIDYLCAIHPAMVGTVVVGGAAGGAGGAGSSGAPGAGSPAPSGAGASAAPGSVAGGVAGGAGASGSGGGSGSGGTDGAPVAVAEIPPGPLGTESILRMGLVVLLSAAAVSVFALLLGSSFRKA